MTHHIHCIENNSQLRKMLRIAPSVNLTSIGRYFAYDEALETFGVKFVKQNVTRIPADGEELKLKIKATQLEKERTEMLICDYIGDPVQSSRSHNVQSRKEKIWELAHLLINAFESANPLENPIFEFCNNLNDEGVNQLVAAYIIGIKRLQTILNQEILLTEDYTTVGRRVRNITRVTVADITKMKKERRIELREEKEKEKERKRGRGRERGRGRGRGKGRGRGEGRKRGKNTSSGDVKEINT